MLRLPTAVLVLALSAGLTLTAPQSAVAQRGWLAKDGTLLPFSSDEEILDFLRSAPVVGFKQLSGGINNPFRLELERQGVRVRAIFRDVDVTKRASSSAAERLFPSFRDSFAFEVAAYELSRLLGLDNVPPVLLYEWRGTQGSLQLWVERARTEGERLSSGESPDDPAGWHRQKTSMLIFDNLIYNFDRNHGNQLLDERGKLWFIDHTRSFKYTPSLPSRDRILVLDAALWDRLLSLDDETVRQRLSPYLDTTQLKALLKRRRLLVSHIERMIRERGEARVLLGRGAEVAGATSR